MLLLDEIENGINSNYAEELIEIFYRMSEAGKQLITTTHSVVFLDYIKKNDIVYLYRESQCGCAAAMNIFELPELDKKLEYMYPGEVIYNTSNKELVEICLSNME